MTDRCDNDCDDICEIDVEFDKDICIDVNMEVDLDWDIDVDVDKDVDVSSTVSAVSNVDGNLAEIVFEVEDFSNDLYFSADTFATTVSSSSSVDADAGGTDLEFCSDALGADTFTQIDIQLLVTDDYVSAAGYMVAAAD